MPAKKKTKKAAGKKKVAKTKTKKTAKKAVKKKAVGKAVKKKTVKRKAEKKSAAGRAAGKAARKPAAKEKPEIVTPVKPPPPPPPPKPKKKIGIDCEHCDATGVCAAGTPYDKSHGQMFGAKVRVTSCIDCLLAAGEHKNSKKLVACRVCDGDGKV